MKIALVGQPNSGKSTFFNAVAGYRSLTSNFPGTTVEYTRGQARVDGADLDLIDLPGLYSLVPTSAVEEVSRDFLLEEDWDVIINVVDASQMARSLELTLELLDLEAPMVVCLNMMDEAARKGMAIDTSALAAALGVPVLEATGGRGQGIVETFRAACEEALQSHHARPFQYAQELEGILDDFAAELGDGEAAPRTLNPRRVDLANPRSTPAMSDPRLSSENSVPLPVLSGSPTLCGVAHCSSGCCSGGSAYGVQMGVPSKTAVLEREDNPSQPETLPFSTHSNGFPTARFRALQLLQSESVTVAVAVGTGSVSLDSEGPLVRAQAEIFVRTGQTADAAISSARHAACLNLFERVVRIARPHSDWRERLDHIAMHPVWGYLVLAGVFLGFFRLIFDVGKLGEDRILAVFDLIVALLTRHMDPHGGLFAAAKGGVLGTAGAVAIVLPYLLPFLAGLAVLEDIGYLSRVGYLMDAAMHKLGLHGTATLPILVGYGCSVPAVMATRILTSRRDRFIAAFLAVLVPCSARMTVIFALVGFYLGTNYALGIYVLNILVVALSGTILARIWPEVSPGMLMEVPAYRVPGLKVVALKTWWRLREFVLVAFPLLVIGSIVLSLVDFYGWQHPINAALSPLTALLGLPRSTGLTLIFGVLRKELSLLMLMQALGTTHVLGAMTAAQIVIFTLFVTFYLPCMATMASMMKELGWRLTLAASGALLALAIVISLAARGVFLLF
jgi:small GTP-binding protein